MSFLPIYGSTPPARHPPVRPPLISTLTFYAGLLIPLVLRTCLRVSQSPHGIAAGWTSLQPWPVYCVVCALLLPPCHLPYLLYAPVPLLVLLILLLPETVWIAHKPLLCPSGSPSATPRQLSPSHPFCRSHQVPCMFGALDLVSDDEVPFACLHAPTPFRHSAHAAAASLAESDDEVPIL
jgi:hypothetical protein